jgi:hypothetical protein
VLAPETRFTGRMTTTREMLDASPAGAPLGVAQVVAAIDTCLNCVQSCTSCANADLAEPDVEEMRACIALCIDCADVCGLVARILSRPVRSDHVAVHRLLEACVRECTLCAEECARHAEHHRHCAICAETCRACEVACRALLDAEAFAELQK